MRFTISLFRPVHLWLLFAISCLETLYSQPGEYYRMIHQAENKVVAENYAQAIPLYKEAFQSIPSPFLKDLHNALLCALKDNDSANAKVFIDEIVKFDVDTNFYFKSTSLKDLHANEKLYAYLKSQLSIKESTINIDCSFFKKRLALDQSIRQTCKELNSNYYAICSDEIKLLDSVNLAKLENFFLSYGVPADINLCNTNPFKTPDYFLIVNHNMQWGRNNLELLLFEAIEAYRLHPLLYSHLRDYYNESYLKQPAWYGMGYNIKLGDRLFVLDVPVEIQESINERRKAIHLDPIDEYNNKVIFQYRHPEFCLIYPHLFFTLDAGPEMEKELAEGWKEFEVFKN
jgi:hypothetical protein